MSPVLLPPNWEEEGQFSRSTKEKIDRLWELFVKTEDIKIKCDYCGRMKSINEKGNCSYCGAPDE